MKRSPISPWANIAAALSPADLAAFDAAFQNYAVAVYQSYFAKYAGQTLKVTGSQARAADDFIVSTQSDRSQRPFRPGAAGSGFPGAHR